MKRIAHKARAIGAALALSAMAAAHAADPIVIMVGGIHKVIYLPAVLTARLGYFRQEGLEVKLISEPAGVNAEDELVAGSVQGVVGFYDHCIDLQSKGEAVESIVQFAKIPGEVELVSTKESSQIRSPVDFRGKTLGVTDIGSSTDFLTQYLAAKAGLKRSDYQLLAVGAGRTFIAAMRDQRIAAGMTTDPTASKLVSSGRAKVLVDMRTEAGTRAVLGGDYPAACLYMSNAWVNAHKGEVSKLARAFVRTLRYMHSHTAEQIADQLPTSYFWGGKAAYVEALKAFLPLLTADGRMPVGGPQSVLHVLATIKPEIEQGDIDLPSTYTTAFVDAVPN